MTVIAALFSFTKSPSKLWCQAAQHRLATDIPSWAISRDGSGDMSFPVYRVYLL